MLQKSEIYLAISQKFSCQITSLLRHLNDIVNNVLIRAGGIFTNKTTFFGSLRTKNKVLVYLVQHAQYVIFHTFLNALEWVIVNLNSLILINDL